MGRNNQSKSSYEAGKIELPGNIECCKLARGIAFPLAAFCNDVSKANHTVFHPTLVSLQARDHQVEGIRQNSSVTSGLRVLSSRCLAIYRIVAAERKISETNKGVTTINQTYKTLPN